MTIANPQLERLGQSFLAQYRFNTEGVPDRYDLQRMTKRSTETIREYAQRWRETAAQVKPPMLEQEMITAFISIALFI